MKNLLNYAFLTLFLGLFSGCVFVNDRGISTQYYNDCKEYYDATGSYQKECPHNIIDWNNDTKRD
ncbi:hypothetical protein [Campylobacter gastrosuis]|uniref:Lipoprotein n=1 Tax=Campylobacter gastrosuis TaxID=2974576 RepID=A0ABT7HNC4_9BACT|nr:hypothetical protein [Campylobacter gastrosuis]MDL0088409.1 hypothetical protein [Campylobacter gastrosuis]